MTSIFVHSDKTGSWFLILSIFAVNSLFTLQPINIFADQNIMVGDNIPNFVLEDAERKQYSLGQMKGKLTFLVMGPKKTEKNNNKWIKMLQQEFPGNESIEIFSIMDMRGIPFFITDNFVRGKVREMQAEQSVILLMDWDQKVNELLGADKDQTDIFVINPNGVLLVHQVGVFSLEKLGNLVQELKLNL